MGAIFRGGEGPVTDLEHVGVVVLPKVDRIKKEAVFGENFRDAFPVRYNLGISEGLWIYSC
jgi:hypothetical protein